MSAKLIFSIAAGGAFGAVGRYVVMARVGAWLGGNFPYSTLAVNVIGSFVLGALVEAMALFWSPGEGMRAFLVVGMMGAFTTFSTFSMDLFSMMEKGNAFGTGVYVTASVLMCVFGYFCGTMLFRTILA